MIFTYSVRIIGYQFVRITPYFDKYPLAGSFAARVLFSFLSRAIAVFRFSNVVPTMFNAFKLPWA